MMPEFVNMASSSNIFKLVVFPLSTFISKLHFSIITGSGVMTIFVYKKLTRNLEIGNNHVLIFPYNQGQGRARDNESDANISNKKLLNATSRGYGFYRF